MENSAKILIVDDEEGMREMLAYELGSRGYEVVTAVNGEDAINRLQKEKFHLMISDINMPRVGGLEALETAKKINPGMEVIMTTGYGTIETAIKAMKSGAYDFVQKPFNLEELIALVGKALEKSELRAVLGIYEASKAVFSSLKLEFLLPVIVKQFAAILKADDVSIMLANEEGRLVMAADTGLVEGERKRAMLNIGERVAGRVAQWKEPVVISGPLGDDPRFSGIPSLRGIKSSIVCPLISGGKITGVISANRTSNDELFTAADLRHAVILGAQMTQAVSNANLYHELEKKIKEIERMQLQLAQSEKLSAVGQLSAGVAHELNNPLTGILGFAQSLLSGESLSAQQREDLTVIEKESQRCRQIIKNLLQFSRPKTVKKEALNIERDLDETLRLVMYDFRTSGLEVTKSAQPDLPEVFGYSFQLQQVFLNLITNARQALEGKAGGFLKISVSAENGNVFVRFEDNGSGISEENKKKIFDPFFTTKAVGKGMGLGLSISYGIIKDHGGDISVESREGQTTIFSIKLPASPERAEK